MVLPARAVSAPWQSDPIVSRAPGAKDEMVLPAQAAQQGPRAAHSLADAIEAGWQSSATGLALRRRLPTIVLDPQHATWYQHLAETGTRLLAEAPEMIAGSIGGSAAGAAAGSAVPGLGTAVGGILGGGAGAMALPTALRTALMERYSKGEATSAADFLNRTNIVLKSSGKDALVGGLTAGAGAAAAQGLAPILGDAVASGALSAGAARVAGAASKGAAEYGAMTISPALLDGRLPEPDDFRDAAILTVGLHAAGLAAGRMREIYARTGVEPVMVERLASVDPTIAEDLKAAPEASPAPAEGPSGAAPEAGKVRWDPSTWAEAAPEPDIPRAFRPLAAATAAADAFPGTKAQAVLDSPFADVPDTKLPYQLNMRYIQGPDDLRALETRMATVYQDEINTARGGTQGWAETAAKAAQQVADMTGQDLQKVMAGRNPGDTYNAVQLKIHGDMLMQATTEAGAAIKAVKDAGMDATDAMKADALASIHRLAMIQADFTGASSELGRALNYLQSIKQLREQGKGIADLASAYKGDPAKLLEMASNIDTPEGLARFSQRINKASTWDMVIEGWKAGLLGPITVVKKSLSDITIMASRPLVDTVAYGFNRLTDTGERMSAVEPLARIFGNVNGIADGLKLAWEELKTEHMGGIAESRGAIPGIAGEVIRTPFRAIEAVTALFRNMEQRGEAYALGARQAAADGLNPGTSEFADRVAQYAVNPPETALDQMDEFGKRMTFGAPLGEKGKVFAKAVETFHAEPIFPFLKAPANVFKEQGRLSPLAPLVGEWRADWKEGGISQNKAAAEMAIGTGLTALGLALAAAGHISGAGDPDPNKRRVAMAAGWQPYSVKLGDTWYSINMIHPVGTLLGMCADIHDASDRMDADQMNKATAVLSKAFAHAVTEQTFLQGMTTLVKAVNEPERQGPYMVQQLAASAVPSVVGQTAQMLDPYKRQVNGILDAIQDRIPGLRQNLNPQRDPWGEPIAEEGRFGVVSPIKEKSPSDDLVRTEAARLGIGAGRAPKSIQLPAAGQRDIGQVPLTSDQQDVFGNVAGHLAHRIMEPIVANPGWAQTPDMIKQEIFQHAMAEGERMGKVAALSDQQRQAEIQRIIGAVSARLQAGR
jgi:hypothetical protein